MEQKKQHAPDSHDKARAAPVSNPALQASGAAPTPPVTPAAPSVWHRYIDSRMKQFCTR